MNSFLAARQAYEAMREKERLAIARRLRESGYAVSLRPNAGKGRADYRSGGRLTAPYDLRNWKYVDAAGDGFHILVSLQAFDRDSASGNRHTLFDRLGLYCYQNDYSPDEAFSEMETTELDLPLAPEDLDRLVCEIAALAERKFGRAG